MSSLLLAIYIIIGTYTGSGSCGIYVYSFDPDTGRSSVVDSLQVENPSYLTVPDSAGIFYAVSESGKDSYANSLRFDRRTGKIALIGRQKTYGADPCNITAGGGYVVTANYTGGNLTVFKTGPGGAIEPGPMLVEVGSSEKQPHMHCVKFSPDGRYLFATDLGKDRICRFTLNAAGQDKLFDAGTMKCFEVPAGSGPRHFVFDHSGSNVYLINEYSGSVMSFRYKNGKLKLFQTIQADTAGGRGSADIVLTPDGRWLYASNRLRNDGIAIFEVDPASGRLTKTGYRNTGLHPRNLAVAPGGKYILSSARHSDKIEVFKIDGAVGDLTPSGNDITVKEPVCVVFVQGE